ncbi:alpha/beta fold hydrolase [Methylibium petroleiphilum]|uniref:alpha/beta fold hydrolase n=1 Tax=Methylibium petroleiphilum TaxID=105560 RepID=UPI001AC99BDF|nr:alpha/beta fold hydrolase [Methylibium petroleiphilum]MBN9203623.1 alpha/beta fold hydrolase [Methylibium petroleiphilum]
MSVSAVLGERRIVQVPEGPIEYRVTGTGPTIVFLHGIIANGDVWRGVVEDLARDHCCITPDWPLGAHALT